jgi:chromosome segregation ATPase
MRRPSPAHFSTRSSKSWRAIFAAAWFAMPGLSLAVMPALLITTNARADDTESETDRLRDALRDALQQARGLQDQVATVQAQLTDMTRDRDRLSRDDDAAHARIKALQKSYNIAVTEFNQRLEERNKVLEKWRSAYEDAADVARAKDAERAKFQASSEAFEADDKVCHTKNAKLVKISNDILAGYNKLDMWRVLEAREPMIGYGGVVHETQVQTYLDQILDQRVQP